MNKPLLNITAKHKLTGKSVDLQFKSIKEAKFFNPDLVEFRVVGFCENRKREVERSH